MFTSACNGKIETAVNDSYITAGITVNKVNEKIITSLEVIVVDSFSKENGIKAEIFTGIGKDFNESFEEISKKAVRTLDLTHTAVLVISENVPDEMFSEIIDFCDKKRAPNSLCFLKAENPEKLFSCKKQSSVTISYDLISSFKKFEKENEKKFRNRLYNLIGKNEERLPQISFVNEEFFILGDNA